MTPHEILDLLGVVGAYIVITCVVSDVRRIIGGPRTFYHWLLPFMWPVCIVSAFKSHIDGDRGWAIWNLLMAVAWYVIWKHDKDDRWKRLRNKAKEKVAERSGRLVVVPVRA